MVIAPARRVLPGDFVRGRRREPAKRALKLRTEVASEPTGSE